MHKIKINLFNKFFWRKHRDSSKFLLYSNQRQICIGQESSFGWCWLPLETKDRLVLEQCCGSVATGAVVSDESNHHQILFVNCIEIVLKREGKRGRHWPNFFNHTSCGPSCLIVRELRQVPYLKITIAVIICYKNKIWLPFQ